MSTEEAKRSLGALRDVRGVEGSVYVSRDGAHVVRDLPHIYDAEPLDGLASRLGRVLDAVSDVAGDPEGMLIRYPGHAVFLRPAEHVVLLVLASGDVSMAALKRGASLVARRLPSLADEPAPVAARPTLPPPPPPRASSPGTFAAPTTQPTPPPLPAPVPPPRPPLAPPESPSGLIDQRPSAPRITVPGAPSSPSVKWRGSTVK